MAKVNPPPFLKTPKEFLKNKETRAYFKAAEFMWFQLWKRSGGGSDLFTSIESISDELSQIDFSQEFSALEQIEDLIPIVDKQFYSAIKNTNYTAVDGDFIDMRQSAIITLDNNAEWNDQIKTRNGDGSLTKVTSTIQIRHKGRRGNTVNIRNEGTSYHWYLFEDGNDKFWAAS